MLGGLSIWIIIIIMNKMTDCNNKIKVKCPSFPKPCKFHKKCNRCESFHFVDVKPESTQDLGSQETPNDWPPSRGKNIACMGRILK